MQANGADAKPPFMAIKKIKNENQALDFGDTDNKLDWIFFIRKFRIDKNSINRSKNEFTDKKPGNRSLLLPDDFRRSPET